MQKQTEVYKEIKDYENSYQCSKFENVKSLSRIFLRKNSTFIISKEKILKPGKNSLGYKTVSLCKNSVPKTFKVSRLVAIHFIPNPENKPQVNHKDYDRLNNN